ncbi:MAG TPA: hypothetical protein VKQ34_02845 [Candidatus Saccharimonadales bacterium]|nr:hypothetical protein [Candidatus Saccharimonadales bacterium]
MGNILGMYGSALPEQQAAQKAFEGLATDYPGLALQALETVIITEREPSNNLEAVAADTIRNYLETGADQFTIFGPEIEEAARPAHEHWRTLNQSSRANSESTQSARLAWRHARVSAFLLHNYTDTKSFSSMRVARNTTLPNTKVA